MSERLESYIDYVDYYEENKSLIITFKPIIQNGSDFLFEINMIINNENDCVLNILLNGTKKSNGTNFILNEIPETINQIIFNCNNVLVKLINSNFCVQFVRDDLKYINLSQELPIDSNRIFDLSQQQTDFFRIMISSLYLLDGEMNENKIVPRKMNEMFYIHNDNIYLNIIGGFIAKDSFTTYNAIPINCVAGWDFPSKDFDFDTNLIVSGEFPNEILNHLPLKDKIFHFTDGGNSFTDEVNIHVRSINKAPLPFGIANN